MGMMPGVAKMKNQMAAANLDDKILKRQMAVIDSMTREERRNPDLLKNSRKKRISAGCGVKVEEINKLLKMHRNMADMMKAMGQGKRGPMAALGNMMGFGGGGGMPSPEQMKELAEKMPGGLPQGMPGLPKEFPGNAVRAGNARSRQADIAGPRRFPRPAEEEVIHDIQSDRQHQEKTMSVVIRLARAGTKKRPFYHVVVANSRFPRDGRFIERLGYFNPLLPKDNETRLKLDLEKVKAWMAKGAQPSDRVMRFLDAAGVAKRKPRNNPQKAVPRKDRGKAGDGACGARGVSLKRDAKWARRICIAKFGAAHGVRGEIRLWPFTEDPLAVANYGPLETEDGKRRFEIAAARAAKDHLVARIKGIDTRDDAEKLNGLELFVAREKLPATDDDEFYHADLIGLAAVTLQRRAARSHHRRAQFRRRRHHRDCDRQRRRDEAAAVLECGGADGRPCGEARGDRAAGRGRGRTNPDGDADA